MIDKELKPTKSVLFNKYGIVITQGISRAKQRNKFCTQYEKLEKSSDVINKNFYATKNSLEMWHDGELIGLCLFNISIKDSEAVALHSGKEPSEEDKKDSQLHISTNLKGVVILQKYRDNGYSEYFRIVIRDLIFSAYSTLCLANPKKFDFVDIYAYSDYTSVKGEYFHEQLFTELQEDMTISDFNLMMGIDIGIEIDAGF